MRRLGPAQRLRLEATIEALIGILDGVDGDPDLEPILGWPNERAGRGLAGSRRDPGDDREMEDEHDEDGGDRESNLGWTVSGSLGACSPFDEEIELCQ